MSLGRLLLSSGYQMRPCASNFSIVSLESANQMQVEHTPSTHMSCWDEGLGWLCYRAGICVRLYQPSLATSPTNTGLRRFGHQMRWYTIRCTLCSSLWYSICCIIQLYRQPCKSETLATLARAGLRAREAGEKPAFPPGLKPCGLRRANSLSMGLG